MALKQIHAMTVFQCLTVDRCNSALLVEITGTCVFDAAQTATDPILTSSTRDLSTASIVYTPWAIKNMQVLFLG